MSENSYEEDFIPEAKTSKPKKPAFPPTSRATPKVIPLPSPRPKAVGGLSIEHFDIFEKNAIIDSPRSLEACHEEGIEPEMLLFKEREHFSEGAQNADIVEMRFEFHEKRRIGLIESVKQRRKEIEQRTNESKLTRVAWTERGRKNEPLNLANPIGGSI